MYILSLPFQLPFYFRYVDDIITAVPSDEITIIKNIFNSYNHKNHKLVDRGITLAHKNFHKENIQKIKSTLLKNNYSHAFLNSIIKKRLNLLSQRGLKTNAHTHEVHTQT